jgi:hypothetical protein
MVYNIRPPVLGDPLHDAQPASRRNLLWLQEAPAFVPVQIEKPLDFFFDWLVETAILLEARKSRIALKQATKRFGDCVEMARQAIQGPHRFVEFKPANRCSENRDVVLVCR